LSDQQRNEWRRREEQSWRQRQNQFRDQEAERQRFWRERERQLQQQRRLNQYRFQQRYWERLRQDQFRLESFTYYDYGAPDYRYYRGGSTQRESVRCRPAETSRQCGYEEGFNAGQAIARTDGSSIQRTATPIRMPVTGYDGYYVDVTEYQYYFREGFRRVMKTATTAVLNTEATRAASFAILGDILNLILDLRRF